MTDLYESLKGSLKDGETIVAGVVSRIVGGEDGSRPQVFFHPTTDVRDLHLEGHRLNTGELISEHHQRTVNGQTPQQFDLKRVAFEGDGPEIGKGVAFIHLDRQR